MKVGQTSHRTMHKMCTMFQNLGNFDDKFELEITSRLRRTTYVDTSHPLSVDGRTVLCFS